MNTYQSRKFDTLYQQNLKALKRQGKSDSTIDVYARAVRRLAERLDRSPHNVTYQELSEHFDWLIEHWSWSTVKVDRNGLQFFFYHILNKEWDWLDLVKPPQVKTMPDILSCSEVESLANATRELRYQAFILLAFSSGMRLGEVLQVQVADIDRGMNRIHVRQGKGNKDRYVPLTDMAYQALKHLWQSHRNPVWLFPCGQSVVQRQAADKPMHRGSTQKAIKQIAADAKINKPVTPHTLRHSFGACLTEAGLSLRAIQEAMGHASPITTARYTQITEPAQQNAQDYFNALVRHFNVQWGAQ